MIEPKFYLKDKNAKKSTVVYLRVNAYGRNIKWYVGESVHPNLWNENKQRVRTTHKIPYSSINSKLDNIQAYTKELIRNSQINDEQLTNKQIKDKLSERFKWKSSGEENSETRKKDLVSYMEAHAEKERSNGKAGYKSYLSTTNILNRFMSVHGRYDFEDIDFDFYSSFVNYLQNQGYSTNYIGKNIKNIKTIMSYAYDEKIHQNDIFRSKRFQAIQEEVYNIYLNVDELKSIYELELEPHSTLDKVRDLFLIGCFVGSRFANWVNIGDAQITKDSIIYESVKHRERIEFPLHWIVKDILKKYNKSLPEPMSNPVFNKKIKEIGLRAGITEEITRVRTIGGKRKTEKFKKYQLITTHTARRSLATNLYLVGIPLKFTMYATGHSRVEQFLKYVRVNISEEAKALKEHPFFTTTS